MSTTTTALGRSTTVPDAAPVRRSGYMLLVAVVAML